jgi:carbamoyl-phosphate synthase small subunit
MSAQASATLTLKDGTKINGSSFGAPVAAAGEVVFATGMVGYPESLTDPSYAGQILVLTYPLVGNYGVPAAEKIAGVEQTFESEKIQIAGLVVSEYSEKYSHHAAVRSLADWLKSEGIPALTGVDTRALTQTLREHGAILGKLEVGTQKVKAWYDPGAENIVARISPTEAKFYPAAKKNAKTVAILDCGMKLNILRSFLARGVSVWHLPHDHDLSGIEFDGLFISNGPGDPAQAKATIATVRQQLAGKKPIFGICLGNQILALASGHKTFKLPYGHRSQNQPVREIKTGRCFVTSQNHGYAVADKMQPGWEVAFENINDGSVEGLCHKTKPFFSVQFHPEACPGPVDAEYLFDEFIGLL